MKNRWEIEREKRRTRGKGDWSDENRKVVSMLQAVQTESVDEAFSDSSQQPPSGS